MNYLIHVPGFPTIACRTVLVAELLYLCFKVATVERVSAH